MSCIHRGLYLDGVHCDERCSGREGLVEAAALCRVWWHPGRGHASQLQCRQRLGSWVKHPAHGATTAVSSLTGLGWLCALDAQMPPCEPQTGRQVTAGMKHGDRRQNIVALLHRS